MTLIEMMVATLILLIGMGGLITLVAGAHRAAEASNKRVAANNLGREVIEAARTIDYDLITPTAVGPALQARPGLAGSGNPWMVNRRNTVYTINARACTFDDPRDGLANGTSVTAPANECLPRASAETGAPAEANPDDFRRVDVTISWTVRGRTSSISLTDSIVNPSGGLGPRILSITEPSGQITGGTSAAIPVTTTPNATSLHWIVDGASIEGDATGGPSSWSIAWPLGTAGTSGAVLDGTYSVNAQPFDARGVPGDTRSAIVQINRSLPFKPIGLVGGRNDSFPSTVVDLEWEGNPERDVLGYRVYRTAGSTTTLVCGTTTKPLLALSCTDNTAPPTGPLSYVVVAVDRTDLANATSALREGPSSTALVSNNAATPPGSPTGLQATVQNNLAHLTWTPPATGSVIFYRIYRDGQQLADRIARTASSAAYFDDTGWGSVGHTYYVSAVNASYNESPRSAPATLVVP